MIFDYFYNFFLFSDKTNMFVFIFFQLHKKLFLTMDKSKEIIVKKEIATGEPTITKEIVVPIQQPNSVQPNQPDQKQDKNTNQKYERSFSCWNFWCCDWDDMKFDCCDDCCNDCCDCCNDCEMDIDHDSD